MNNYSIQSVSVQLDNTTFLANEIAKRIPSNIFENGKLYIIPTIAYEVLKKEIKKEENNNFTFVNAYLEIIKTLYKFDKRELNSNILKSIAPNGYKSYLELIRQIIFKSEYPTFNGEAKDKSTIHTMRSYADLTFISLSEQNLDVRVLDFDYDGLKDTPLNNDNFINTLMNAKIDATSAINAEYNYVFDVLKNDKDKYKIFMHRVNAILAFLQVRRAKKANKVDRVYSSFTNLSKIARQYLTMNKKHFTEIDIKNCQPLLLVILAIENNLELDSNYILDVRNGNFYERLMKEAKMFGFESETIYEGIKSVGENIDGHYYNNTKKITLTKTLLFANRDDVKVLCYNDIFFTNNRKETRLVKCFKSLYPKTYKVIEILTENNSLALQMQNLEADIVLNILPNSPYYTVHDAIYVSRSSEINNVKKMITNEIYNRTNGLIKNIKFGSLEDNKIIIEDNTINTEEIIIKQRAVHSVKNKKFNAFLSLYENMHQEDVIKFLNINLRTYFRYKKQAIENK